MTAPTTVPIEDQQTRSWWLRFDDIPIGPNDHVSRWARAKQNKRWRRNAWGLAKEREVPPCERIAITVVFHRRAVGKADEDNDRARLKPVIDGIVDAGVIPDDKRKFIKWGPVIEMRGKRGFDVLIEELSQ